MCTLPHTLKMWHVLAKDLITAQHRPRPHIGDWPGLGRDNQIAQIAAAIRSDEQAVVVADVVRAFPTVSINAVYDLPYLPEAMTRRTIDYRSLRFTDGYRSARLWGVPSRVHDDLEMAPSGLLEGSPVSNAIFSVLLDDLPDHLNETILAFVYCDNIILVAPSNSQAREAANHLVRYFADHRAGPFEVRHEVRSLRHGFDHLGYSVARCGEVTRVGLAPKSWEKLMGRLEDQSVPCDDTLLWLGASFGALDAEAKSNCLHIIAEEDWRRRGR